MKKSLAQRIASMLMAIENCEKSNNLEWRDKHEENLEKLVKDHLPSGSGFDNGTILDRDKSTPEKLVFSTSFHHTDEGGMYDGWTEHTVTVRSSLVFGYTINVSGKNRNDIKEYIAESFHISLSLDTGD